MKDLIFISHANPEDNYFATWLAAKLNVLGYNAWVDVDDFKVGDAFFNTIQPLIKEKAIRFIAVNSEAYINKSKDQNTGVSRELNTAILVRDIENFILPIKIDLVSYSDFPSHYASWNTIDFSENWQDGLIDLVKQLVKMDIPKENSVKNPIDTWFKVIKNENKVIDKQEECFSNWFAFDLPEDIYIHYPENPSKEAFWSYPYPFTDEANRIISFSSDGSTESLKFRYSKKFKTHNLISSDEIKVDNSFVLKEPKKKVVRLLNQCFRHHLMKSDLSYWKKRDLNYFVRSQENKRVSLKERFGKTSRVLVGEKTAKINKRKQSVNWHYAINTRVELHPFPHYRLFYTLVFTDESGRGVNKTDSRNLRRSVPADWYNRKWFETMLAAMLKLSESSESEEIKIEIDENVFLSVSNLPVGSTIEKGYIEP
jgi:hypothetical protein